MRGKSISRCQANSRQTTSDRNPAIPAACSGLASARKLAAVQRLRGLISPKARCSERFEVASRSGRSRETG